MLRVNKGTNEKMDKLCRMIRTNPYMRSCLNRLVQSCLANPIKCMERGKELEANLQEKISKHYSSIFHAAVESAIACGFVPMYIRKIDGVPFAHVLPLGSYTWEVEVCKSHSKKRKYESISPVFRYKITVLHGKMRDDEIFVVNYEEPVLLSDQTYLQSPCDHLLGLQDNIKTLEELWMKGKLWNADKHIAITEDVNISDQTMSGIQLLDDFRRYRLSGVAGGSAAMGRTGASVMRQGNKTLETVNDANFAWLQSQFKDGETDAKIHILPPNMNIQELAPVDLGTDLQEARDNFVTEIFSFFDLPRIADLKSSATTSGSSQMNKQQHRNIVAMCMFLQRVCEVGYAMAFEIPIDDIKFNVSPQPRLTLNGSDDVKALCDANIFPEGQRIKLQSLYDMS